MIRALPVVDLGVPEVQSPIHAHSLSHYSLVYSYYYYFDTILFNPSTVKEDGGRHRNMCQVGTCEVQIIRLLPNPPNPRPARPVRKSSNALAASE